MPSREVKVAIIGDPSSLRSALRSADQGVTNFGQRMQQVGSRMRSVGSTLTRSLTLPLIGFGIIAARELSDSETKLAQTQAVIESTGGAARKTVGDITDLAQGLSEMSSVDDEDIQGLANTLLTFRNIAGRTFDDATAAALDLSVAMGTDLHAAGIQIGKALNDPIKGLTALTRVGVTFTAQQREAIQAMVFFGDTAGAQRIILEELNAEFGGSAEALGNTLTGRLQRAKNRFEELSAEILSNLIPAIERIADLIETLADKFDNLTPKQQQIVAGMIAFAAVAGPLTSVLGLLTSGIGAVVGVMASMAAALGISTGLFGALAVAIVVLVAQIVFLIYHWQQVKDIASSAINSIVANVPGAGAVVRALGVNIQIVTGFWRGMIEFVRILGSLTLGALRAAVQVLTGNLQQALATAQQLVNILQTQLPKAPVQISTGVGGGSSLNSGQSRPSHAGESGRVTEAAMERAFRRALREEIQMTAVVGGVN